LKNDEDLAPKKTTAGFIDNPKGIRNGPPIQTTNSQNSNTPISAESVGLDLFLIGRGRWLKRNRNLERKHKQVNQV